MPMLLTIALDDDGHQQSAHCSVALPTDVVASLNELTPYASLVILRLQVTSPSACDVHVAWHGDSIPRPGFLSIHSRFADALHLQSGHQAKLTVVERVHSAPKYPLLSTTLRPLSYETLDTTANAHFHTLSSTAETLQQTFLSRIRVLCPSLVFPIVLPAGECILVTVVSIRSGGPDACETPPYAILLPDSQVEIESPPLRNAQTGSHSRKPLRRFCRVAAVPRSHFANLSDAILRTHAFLPPSEEKRDDGNLRKDSITILVSRKLVTKPPTIAVPVSVIEHSAVPPRTIALPPAIWHRLQLTPLTPVLIEEIDTPRPTPSTITFAQITAQASEQNDFATSDDFISASATYFHGMRLRSGFLLTHSQQSSVPILPEDSFVEPWFDPSLQVPEDELLYLPDLDDELLTKPHTSIKRELQRAASQRTILKAYQTNGDTIVKTDTQSALAKHVAQHHGPTDSDGYPWKEEVFRHTLLQSLTPSVQSILQIVVKSAHKALFEMTDEGLALPVKCSVLVIEGSEGSGRSFTCMLLASVLRDAAHVRTVWLDGRAHSGEKVGIRLRRLEAVFSAAMDEGKGLIVLDDFDDFVGRVSDSEEEDAKGNAQDTRQNARILAEKLETLVQRQGNGDILVVLACERAQDLPENLRAPFFISHLASLKVASLDDRAFMFFRAMKEKKTPPSKLEDLVDDTSLAKNAFELASLTEGYSARDIQVCLTRARVSITYEQEGEAETQATLFQAVQSTLQTMIPSSRIGLKIQEQKQEQLSWSKLGGLSHVISELQEALQLPSSHRELFTNVPIRLPHGILIYGPPGCGKTLLAKTAAAESQLQCIVVKGPELMGKYVGQSEAEVRNAFDRASACAPSVLLFDEFDALAPCRGGWDGGVTDRVVNSLLTCMDGVERLSDGVYIVTTSSRPEVIDPALLRPGRLDRWVEVNVPEDGEQRFDILKRIAVDLFSVGEVVERGLWEVAQQTEGYTGADLGAILNDAFVSLGELDQDGGDEDDGDGGIVRALMVAQRNSRPSLSRSQRARYEHTMARFSGRERGETASESFGKRLTFK